MKQKWMGILVAIAVLCVPLILKLTQRDALQAVDVEEASTYEIKASILASGHLAYQEQVLLSPEVIGKVSTLFVKEGQQVRAGELVLRLDDHSYRAEVAQQEAAVRQQRINIEHQQLNVANQESQYKRKEYLFKMKMIADVQADDARYAVDLAKIDLRNSREALKQVEAILTQSNERLAKTNIVAPISGTITALDIKVGETAVASQVGIAGSSLMTIANTATMLAEVNVDEADIAKMAVGQEASIHTAAYPDVAIKGEVQNIPLSPKRSDSAQGQGGASLARNYSIKVKFVDAKGLTLRPGMTCRVDIFTASSGKSLALPLQAVLSNNDENVPGDAAKKGNAKTKRVMKIEDYVFVNKGGIAEKRLVTLGISDDSRQEILTGLSAGESIITGPYKVLRYLNDGDKVKGNAVGKSAPAQKTKS
jgi:HlyD family secretion protein